MILGRKIINIIHFMPNITIKNITMDVQNKIVLNEKTEMNS